MYRSVCYSVTVYASYYEIMLFDVSSGLDLIVKMCFNDSLQLIVFTVLQYSTVHEKILQFSNKYNTLYGSVCYHHHSNNIQYNIQCNNQII